MKRSVPVSERKEQLIPGSIYVITCKIANCPCSGRDVHCGRGFFSLFLQAINGIDFAARYKLIYHVNFGNCIYRYSESSFKDNNFWNYYFEQPLIDLKFEKRKVLINQFNEVYPLRIWHKSYFRYINRGVIQSLRFKENVSVLINEALLKFKDKKVLGIQVRLTDHGDEITPVVLSSYIKVINRYSKKFDQVFVATDDQPFLQRLVNTYGDKILFNDVIRSTDGEAVHTSSKEQDRYKLGLDVLIDCYCLSKCDKLILVSSNISYCALLFNPEVPYLLMERTKTKIKRWKTLTVYLLDKWGIRKW